MRAPMLWLSLSSVLWLGCLNVQPNGRVFKCDPVTHADCTTPQPDGSVVSTCQRDADCGDHGLCSVSTGTCSCSANFLRCGGACAACPTAAVMETACVESACVASLCAQGFHACAQGCCPWQVEPVPQGPTEAYLSRLVVTGSGQPVVAYLPGYGVGEVRLGTLRDGGWVTEGPVFGSSAHSNSLSLALDTAGRVHLGALADGGLQEAVLSGGTWASTFVDGSTDVLVEPSLAVGGDDTRHLAYASAGGALMYARVRAGWGATLPTSVDAQATVGWVSLALDGSGNPLIAYGDLRSGQVKLARGGANGWSTETVDRGDVNGEPGRFGAMALDRQGNVHIVYSVRPDDLHSQVRYAYRAGGTWSTERVVAGFALFTLAMQADRLGTPHVVFHDNDANQLGYALRVGGTWYLTRLNGVDQGGSYPALALGREDEPYIVFSVYSIGGLGLSWAH